MSEKPASVPYEFEFDVPPAAIDANGHANNVEYVHWMQEAAERHYVAVGGLPLMAAAGATWVVRSHHIEYLRPAIAGDRLRVRTWVEDSSRAMSLRRYEFIRAGDQTVLARGETQWVFVDARTGRPMAIPDEIRGVFGG